MFFEKAREGYNHWWRYLVGILAVFAGYAIGQIPLILAITRSISDDPNLDQEDFESFFESSDFSIFGINNNMGFTLLLIMFLGAFAALYFVFKPLHQREFRTLITSASRINWSKILFGFGTWLALSLILEVALYFVKPDNYIFQFHWNTFIPLLLLSIFLLPIQTSTEEFIFRSYLMQGLGNATWLRKIGLNIRLIPLIVTSVLFGLVHSMNPEIHEFGFGIMQTYYISAGLVLGIMTLMDDSLELALGVHAATNFVGAVFVGYDGAAIQTDSLFKTQELNPTLMLIGFIIMAILFLLLCKYRFNWTGFGKLLRHIEPQETDLV